MLKNLKIDLSYGDTNKIISALFSLRQRFIDLNNVTYIDDTSKVNKPIKKEVDEIDNLLSRMQDVYMEFEKRREIESKEASLMKKNVV